MKHTVFQKFRIFSLFVSLALLCLVSACGETARPRPDSLSFFGDELRVACFGGSIERQMDELAGQVVEPLTGCQIKWIVGTSRTHLEALRKAKKVGNKPPFDVVLLDGIIQQMAGKEELLENSTEEQIPQIARLIPQAKTKTAGGPAFQFFSVGICYYPDGLSEAGIPEPTSWGDFWRPGLKGRIAVPSISHAAGIDFVIAAARVAGGDPRSLDGLKKGIDAIAKLRPAYVYGPMSGLRQSMEDGKVLMAPLYNSRSYGFIDSGLSLRFILPREKGFGHLSTINVTRGCPVPRLARLFVNTVLGPAYQFGQAIETPFGPVNSNVIEHLRVYEKIVRRVPLGSEGLAGLCIPDWEVINKLRTELEDYWYKKFPQPKGE